MERTGSRPTQFGNVAVRGDVQTGGVMRPRRKATRIPIDKISSSAFKIRRSVPAAVDRIKRIEK